MVICTEQSTLTMPKFRLKLLGIKLISCLRYESAHIIYQRNISPSCLVRLEGLLYKTTMNEQWIKIHINIGVYMFNPLYSYEIH